jgi:hypothetical protein
MPSSLFRSLALLLVIAFGVAHSQEGPVAALMTQPPPPIQDNSFLLEEAYNQEDGVIQHISTFARTSDTHDWVYSFTEEWPVPGHPRHQVSYTMLAAHNGGFPDSGAGLGDFGLNYRYQVVGNGESRVAFAPRFTVLLPTGNSSAGRSVGGVAWQGNLPLSVQLNQKFVTHWNAGATVVPNARNAAGDHATASSYSGGASVIWLAHPQFNVLLESLFVRYQNIEGPSQTSWSSSVLLSPGVRWAFNFRNGLQIVPGVAVPVGVGSSAGQTGVFAYLSFEHPFRWATGRKE